MTTPVLPDFTRWSWASVPTRQWFAPLVASASNAFHAIERWAVVDGIRPAAFQFIPYADVPAMAAWAANHDLVMVPIVNSYTNGYNSTPNNGTPNSLRVIFTHIKNYKNVLPLDSDEKIGTLLGYPECCRKAFDATWGKGQVDSTFEQFTQTKSLDILRMVHNTPYSHTLLRWLGIRAVSHMPCHHYCRHSQDIAEAMLHTGTQHGYLEDVLFIQEALRWSFKWSRLFGIAEIVSPAVKISTRTDWTATKDKFEHKGKYAAPDTSWWTDNGYSTPDTMRAAHQTLVITLKDSLPREAKVLDLGCGNGMLLKRLKLHRPDIKICGIDSNMHAITRAGLGHWRHGRIEDTDVWTSMKPDAVLFTPGRLSEMSPEDQQKVTTALNTLPVAYLYQYADWKQPLAEYAALGGWSVNPLTKTPLVEIGIRHPSK